MMPFLVCTILVELSDLFEAIEHRNAFGVKQILEKHAEFLTQENWRGYD
jgi:hypothetical protein